jgi:ubiquinone/menaquinone biosynthesis C-methylase UbiE
VSNDKANVCIDLQHQLFLITLEGKLHLAPLKDPQLVLDIGTGTGIWAVEYGISRLQRVLPQGIKSIC